jgi:uncharacterized membrane protein (UPF0127 family)
MLFAYEAPVTSSFTMSTVRTPLDIGFYDRSGRLVDRLLMTPCRFSDADCPSYRASGEYKYAIETLPGDLPRGDLSG